MMTDKRGRGSYTRKRHDEADDRCSELRSVVAVVVEHRRGGGGGGDAS